MPVVGEAFLWPRVGGVGSVAGAEPLLAGVVVTSADVDVPRELDGPLEFALLRVAPIAGPEPGLEPVVVEPNWTGPLLLEVPVVPLESVPPVPVEVEVLAEPALWPPRSFEGGGPPDFVVSAWASPDPLSSAALTPSVTAPVPNQVETSLWRW